MRRTGTGTGNYNRMPRQAAHLERGSLGLTQVRGRLKQGLQWAKPRPKRTGAMR
jgi:hypothetical protein